MSASDTISVSELAQLRQSDPSIRIIDVRTPLEFSSVHAEGAVNIPLDRASAETIREGAGIGSERVYLICKSGMRSNKACQKLMASQVTNVVNVVGGTDAWVAAGLPVVRGRPALSVEQQTRIVAGLLVLAGVWLATSIRLEFIGLSAFVGAGLLMAGGTGWCPMGTMLARMPWNQKGSTSR